MSDKMNEEKNESVSSENTETVEPETEETAEKLDKKDKKAVKLLEKQLEDSKNSILAANRQGTENDACIGKSRIFLIITDINL